MRRRNGLGRGLLAAAAVGVGLAGREAVRRRLEADLRGQVALVTGGSRGLGYLLAREFGRQGCRLAICARDAAELEQARADLSGQGFDVLAVPCDVGDRAQVEQLVAATTAHYGQIDLLVNNAGIIQAGPFESQTEGDFREALDVMYWGVLYPTLAVLPQMRARRAGRLVNVTSIGGKVAVPHLLPYDCAKFAAVALSEGLRAELARDGITVTTIVPVLMRTGSILNAVFKGPHRAEFAAFSVLGSLPLVSMDAERAARQIVAATRHGDAERVLGLPATLLARFHGLFPGATADILGLVNRALPRADGAGGERARGMALHAEVRSPLFDRLIGWNLAAARRYHEYPGPVEASPQAAPDTGRAHPNGAAPRAVAP